MPLTRKLFLCICLLHVGYASYLAYIQVEAAYTNPVLNVFIHLLTEQIEVKLPTDTTHKSCKDI